MKKKVLKKPVKPVRGTAQDFRTREALDLAEAMKELVYRFAKRHTDERGEMKPEFASCVSAALLAISVNHWSIMLKNLSGAEIIEFLGQESLKIAEAVINRRGRNGSTR